MKLRFLLQKCPWLVLMIGVACLSRLGFAAQAAEPSLASPPPPTNAALTLNDALQLALANNPELRACGARIDAAAGRAYQAKLWSNPGTGAERGRLAGERRARLLGCQADRRASRRRCRSRERRSSTGRSAAVGRAAVGSGTEPAPGGTGAGREGGVLPGAGGGTVGGGGARAGGGGRVVRRHGAQAGGRRGGG